MCDKISRYGGFCKDHDGADKRCSEKDCVRAAKPDSSFCMMHSSNPILPRERLQFHDDSELEAGIQEDEQRLQELKRQMEAIDSQRKDKLKRIRLQNSQQQQSSSSTAEVFATSQHYQPPYHPYPGEQQHQVYYIPPPPEGQDHHDSTTL